MSKHAFSHIKILHIQCKCLSYHVGKILGTPHEIFYILDNIGHGNRGAIVPLKFKTSSRIIIFAIENHFSLVKWPPLLLVASSTNVRQPLLTPLFSCPPPLSHIYFSHRIKIIMKLILELYLQLCLHSFF